MQYIVKKTFLWNTLYVHVHTNLHRCNMLRHVDVTDVGFEEVREAMQYIITDDF